MARAVVLRSRPWTTQRTTRRRPYRCLRHIRAAFGSEFEEMDREMDRVFDLFSRAQRHQLERFYDATTEIQREAERASGAREMRMEKIERRTDHSYYYYESVTVGGNDPWTRPNVASSSLVPYGVGGLWTALMFILGVVYAILTFRFNQAFGNSSFREDQRLKLSLLWPGLLLSPDFRKKFSNMVSNPTNKKE